MANIQVYPTYIQEGSEKDSEESDENESRSKSELSDEIQDYTQYGMPNMNNRMHPAQMQMSMLQPEKTCKTIRELSNEDMMSSMGNVSANISPQIQSVKAISIHSKNASMKLKSRNKRLRRR